MMIPVLVYVLVEFSSVQFVLVLVRKVGTMCAQDDIGNESGQIAQCK